jgi:hypothetical protein
MLMERAALSGSIASTQCAHIEWTILFTLRKAVSVTRAVVTLRKGLQFAGVNTYLV